MTKNIIKVKRYHNEKLLDEMSFTCSLENISDEYVPYKHVFYDLNQCSLPNKKQMIGLSQRLNISNNKFILTTISVNGLTHYCLYDTVTQLKRAIICLSKENYPHGPLAFEQDINILTLLKSNKYSLSELYEYVQSICLDIIREKFILKVVQHNIITLNKTFFLNSEKMCIKNNNSEFSLKFLIRLGKPELSMYLGIISSSEHLKDTVKIKKASTQSLIEIEDEDWETNSQIKLQNIGIYTKKDWRKWTIENHPDRTKTLNRDFHRIISAGKKMDW